jgi:hypothetical protein
MSLERLRDGEEAQEPNLMKKLQISPSEEAGCKVGPLFASEGTRPGECLRKALKKAQNTANDAGGRGLSAGL